MSDVLGQQWQPITSDEARGDSKPVTRGTARKMAKAGKSILDSAPQTGAPGLAQKWHQVKDMAWEASREPWGGVTVNAESGTPVTPKQGYAVTARRPGQSQVTVHATDTRDKFDTAMDNVRGKFPQLETQGTHLGVFHDADTGDVDMDPVRIAKSKREANAIGSYSHATGGAYDYSSGNAHWVPHVK